MNGTNWDDLFSDSARLDGVPVSELLSAYYDGELPAEQRLRVEAWLEEHPKGREILAQFSELSSLVGGAAVLSSQEQQQVAAQSLQNRVLSRVASPPETAPRVGPSWMRWGAALLAVAATLTLVVFLVPPGNLNQPVAMNAAPQNAPFPDAATAPAEIMDSKGEGPGLFHKAAVTVRGQAEPAPAPMADEALPAPKMAADSVPTRSPAPAPAVGSAPTRSLPEPAPSPLAAPPSPSPGFAPSPKIAMESPQGSPSGGARGPGKAAARQVAPGAAAGASAAAPNLPRLAPGTRVDPGEIIHHLATQGDEAVVIEYTVVDVRKAAGELEVLLRKRGIETLPAVDRESGESLPKKGDAGNKEAGSETGMFAIYVEADNDQLAAALKEFRAQPSSLEVVESQVAAKRAEEKSKDAATAPKNGAGQKPGDGGDEAAEVARSQVAKPQSGQSLAGQQQDAREQAYQVPFPISRTEAQQIPRRSQKMVKQQGYGDYLLEQRRVAEPKGETAETANRVLIVIQAEDAEKM